MTRRCDNAAKALYRSFSPTSPPFFQDPMNMKHLRIAGCAAALMAAVAVGAEPAGYVKTVTGQASIVSNGRTVAATPGAVLAAGDTLTTGADGSLGVTLRDNTLLSFGPSTSFTLENYLFAPAKGELRLGGRITNGSLHYVSGAISKLKPEAVEIKTPSGTIGVRGTRFAVVTGQ